jgi:elongator complex protein 1
VPVPILESSYPLPDAPTGRPRQIAFLNETEVYLLKASTPGISHIERTALETRETQVVYQAQESEELYSIFAGVGHSALWFSHAQQPGLPASYSTIDFVAGNDVQATIWSESPTFETHWARAVSISDDEVNRFRRPIFL